MKELHLRDLIARFLKDDKDAISFIMSIHDLVEIWDDLVDKDNPVSQEQVNSAFYAALITIPRNQFYARHFAELNLTIENAIIDWMSANALEATGDAEKLRMAYVLRSSAMTLTTVCANIIGGPAWALKVNTEFRAMGDTWDEYAAGFSKKEA